MYATKFKHKVVQDLVWVMESPVFLNPEYIPTLEQGLPVIMDNEFCSKLLNSSRQWLAALDTDPEPLKRFLNNNTSKFLGPYFELLVEYWIKERINPQFFKSHIQVFNNNRTFGEYDFLFSSANDNKLVHLEVAVKFYLYYQTIDGEVRFIGPNANDSLDIKLNHLLNHQLKLSKSAPGQMAIHSMGFRNTVLTVLMKGYLFYPPEYSEQADLPKYLSSTHLKGWWTSLKQFCVPCHGSENRWTILEKSQWLGPLLIHSDSMVILLDINELKTLCLEHFKDNQRSLLVVELEKKKLENWQEVARGFVVSDTWPELKVRGKR